MRKDCRRREYRSRERILMFRIRREETVIETVDFYITNLHTIFLWSGGLSSVTRQSKRRWHTVSQLNRGMAKIVTIEKRERRYLMTKRKMIKRLSNIRIINETNGFRFNLVKKSSERKVSPFIRTIFHARENKSHI